VIKFGTAGNPKDNVMHEYGYILSVSILGTDSVPSMPPGTLTGHPLPFNNPFTVNLIDDGKFSTSQRYFSARSSLYANRLGIGYAQSDTLAMVIEKGERKTFHHFTLGICFGHKVGSSTATAVAETIRDAAQRIAADAEW
jgi:hypothetical protein